ncbi:MAG: hypothetical protein ACLFVP_09085 [Candidatus Bathyarchaeia archaeon]
MPSLRAQRQDFHLIEEFVELLRVEGIDLSLVLVLDEGDKFTVSPRGYISGSWKPVNEAIRKLGGRLISADKRSRWEIDKEELNLITE